MPPGTNLISSGPSPPSWTPPLPAELTELNIVTLNCWGLLYLSKDRASRLAAIGQALAASDPAPHIVGLQECWTQEDYQAIRRATRFILPYGKFYHSGAFGGGLAILSRWPIQESSMVRYPLNGRPTAFFRGDWFVGKGVACARIRYGKGPNEVVEVFNTHTHPAYEDHKKGVDTYSAHRLSQAWELSKLVRGAAERGHLVVALGDFNDVPLSLQHRILTSHAPVRDVWRVLHPDSSLGSAQHDAERARRRPIPTAEFNIRENGATSNNAYNTWRWPKKQQKRPADVTVAPDTSDPRGQRLDYIFVSSGTSQSERHPGWGWVVKDARVGMLQRHPELGCSLSDHFSVEATLILYHSSLQSPGSDPLSHENTAALAKSPTNNDNDQSLAAKSNSDYHLKPADGGGGDATSMAETRATEIPEAFLTAGIYLQTPTASDSQLPLRHNKQKSTTTLRDHLLATSYEAQLQDAAQPVERLPPSTYDEIIAVVQAYMARERSQRRSRSHHFFAWVGVTLACYVGVCSLGLVAGTTDGLIALLFIGSEMRALKEFEWEIMNAKAHASGAGGAGFMKKEGHEERSW
ncbi:Bcisc1 [Apiospora aurea]|uniref:Bcisc1 n=1 Tax=Apiospora aurea TaxID=335848 RepID=A0ABR1PVP4_9PEZI